MNSKKTFLPFGRYLSIKKLEEPSEDNSGNLFKTSKDEPRYGEYVVLASGNLCINEYSGNEIILVQNGMVEKYNDLLFVLENYVVGGFGDGKLNAE